MSVPTTVDAYDALLVEQRALIYNCNPRLAIRIPPNMCPPIKDFEDVWLSPLDNIKELHLAFFELTIPGSHYVHFLRYFEGTSYRVVDANENDTRTICRRPCGVATLRRNGQNVLHRNPYIP